MITTIVAGYGLGAAGGGAFVLHSGWAPYLVSASCIILVVRSVLTAWMLMFERRHHDADGVNKPA
jgi:predicted MFS family arabinose efflux permease